jgi:hypothetical protein
MVGSIGVVAAIPVQVAPDAGGDLWIEIVSTNAPNKRPDPVSEDGRIEIVATLDAVEKQFVADVHRKRHQGTCSEHWLQLDRPNQRSLSMSFSIRSRGESLTSV